MKTNRGYIYGCVLAVMIVLLMAANLVFGSVDIPVKSRSKYPFWRRSRKRQLAVYRMGVACSSVYHGSALWNGSFCVGLDAANRI